jgi:hypothetical protein
MSGGASTFACASIIGSRRPGDARSVASGMEMSLTMLAAFLTIVGYSISDKIVIFDRIRKSPSGAGKTSIRSSTSINGTLSRTVITGARPSAPQPDRPGRW